MPASKVGRPQRVSDDEIFAAFAEVVTEHGPTGLSLNSVAKKLGLTGPALGYRFKNKQRLLLAFAEHQVNATDERFTRVAASAATPRDAIATALTELGSAATTKAQVANNLAMLHLDLTDEALGACAAHQSRIIRSHLVTMLAAAGVEESACDDLADDLYTTWSGATITWAIGGTGPLSQWIEERIARVLDRSIKRH